MKLIMAIVNNDDANRVQKALATEGFSVTKLATTGGFLMAGNTTFIAGTEDERVEHFFEILRKFSKRRLEKIETINISDGAFIPPTSTEIMVGGATVFVMNIERYEKM